MINIISFLICFAATLLLSFVPIWWFIVLAPIVVYYFFGNTYSQSFIGGFLSVFFAWFLFILFVNSMNDSILSEKIAEIIPFHKPILLIVASAFVGGIIGAMGGLIGYSLQSVIVLRKKGKTKYG